MMKKHSQENIRILLTNATCMYSMDCEYNKGSAAVGASAIKVLKKFLPYSEFISLAQYSRSFAEIHNVRVIENKTHSQSLRTFSLYSSLISSINLIRCFFWHLIYFYLNINIRRLVNNKILKEIYDADLIVDLSMDLYSDNLGTISMIEHSKDLLCGILLGKPTVVFAQSLGPFRKRINSILAKFTLNRVSLITVREELAREYLNDIGVYKPPIYLTADPAFVLDSANKKDVEKILDIEGIDKNSRPLIGIVITPVIVARALEDKKYTNIIKSLYKAFLFLFPDAVIKFIDKLIKNTGHFSNINSNLLGMDVITKVIKYLNEELNATILLIPHSITPEERLGPIGDDRSIAKNIYNMLDCKDNVKLIANEYKTEELKGLIGQCDMLISSKMHANIAALSQCVPVIAIAYSHKFYAIMKMLGQEEYICNLTDYEKLIEKINDVWINAAQIRAELEVKIPLIKEKSMLNGYLVKQLLESHN